MNPSNKLTIIGGGIIGAWEAYFALADAKSKNSPIRVTINERNEVITETTSFNIAPSLTPDEIMSVVPRGDTLVQKLGVLFSEAGGIKVVDVPGVNNSMCAQEFVKQVQQYSKDEQGHKDRSQVLLGLGKYSMDLWQKLYENAEPELKKIFEESNFQPCCELPKEKNNTLHNGYRIDLIYKDPDAVNKAADMVRDYKELGYSASKSLTPDEVKALDPFLTTYCDEQSLLNEKTNKLEWKPGAIAVYRPGGCIDTASFLPKFYEYLKKFGGKYINSEGKEKDCFRLKYNINVDQLIVNSLNNHITAMEVNGKKKVNKHHYKESEYVFCPGENVNALEKFGFQQPAYTGFAGASLKLKIMLNDVEWSTYKNFNHCMEVHQQGIVLAWQARASRLNKEILINVAGTKSFYADQKPNNDQAFAKNRHVLQLNMINEVLPDLLSKAFKRNTKGTQLNFQDLNQLLENNVAKRWVGTRAVAYDGFPTIGPVYNQAGLVKNARVTTHLGSGGVSFAPASVLFSQKSKGHDDVFARDQPELKQLHEKVLKYSQSNRKS